MARVMRYLRRDGIVGLPEVLNSGIPSLVLVPEGSAYRFPRENAYGGDTDTEQAILDQVLTRLFDDQPNKQTLHEPIFNAY